MSVAVDTKVGMRIATLKRVHISMRLSWALSAFGTTWVTSEFCFLERLGSVWWDIMADGWTVLI